jgi:uncharacterized membrane protein
VDAPSQTPAGRGRSHRITIGVTLAVIVIWLVGAAVTKFTLGQMALLAPIAVVVVGVTAGLVLLWVKIVLQLLRERRERRARA